MFAYANLVAHQVVGKSGGLGRFEGECRVDCGGSKSNENKRGGRVVGHGLASSSPARRRSQVLNSTSRFPIATKGKWACRDIGPRLVRWFKENRLNQTA